MAPTVRAGWSLVGLAGAAGFVALVYFAGRPPDPQKVPQRIQAELAQIRGLPFKRQVIVERQSQEELRKHLQAQYPQLSRRDDVAKVLSVLGLLLSGEVLSSEKLDKNVTPTKLDGYYDPDSGRVFVAKQPAADPPGLWYARELYHALQDQHFDLNTYLPVRSPDSSLSYDEMLARKAVVEGEALYASVMWTFQYEHGQKPTNHVLSTFVSKLNEKEQLTSLVNTRSDPRFRASLGQEYFPPRSKPGSGPTFIYETKRAMDRDGINFVHAVGWSRVEQLYKGSPPVSTEQILHPHKWFSNERPVKIQWPDLKTHKLFADWELLATDVLGELQWRIVFKVQGLSPIMSSAPDGWNGDRFAVFKRRDSNDMLLLMYTVWDTEAAAAEFASTYRVAAGEKYAEVSAPPMRVVEQGKKVVIVEGGDEKLLDAYVKFAQSAQETAPAG